MKNYVPRSLDYKGFYCLFRWPGSSSPDREKLVFKTTWTDAKVLINWLASQRFPGMTKINYSSKGKPTISQNGKFQQLMIIVIRDTEHLSLLSGQLHIKNWSSQPFG